MVVLIRRRMPTETHKEIWRRYEHMLNIRANFCFFIIFLQNVFESRASKSEDFIQNSDEKSQKQLAMALLPTVAWIILIMNLLRLPLIVASYWKPQICRYYHIYQVIFMAVRQSAPIDYGDVVYLIVIEFAFQYALLSYTAWRQILCQVICLAYAEIAVRLYLYVDVRGLETLLIHFAYLASFLVCVCLLIHMMISWVGFTYLATELPCKDNESLLNNLKEGVLIIDERTAKVQFINTAAAKINNLLQASINLSLLKPDDVIANAQFHLVEYKKIKNEDYQTVKTELMQDNTPAKTMQ